MYNKINELNMDVQIDKNGFLIFDSISDIELLESYGFKIPDCGFNDEYILCEHCNTAIEIHPYNITPQYTIIDNEIICTNCLNNNDDDLIIEYIDTHINNSKIAISLIDEDVLKSHGFIKCSCNDNDCKFENGLYEGTNDKPDEILQNAIYNNKDKDFVFQILNVNPFNVDFTLWHRLKE